MINKVRAPFIFILLYLLLAGCSQVQQNTDLEKSIDSIVTDENNCEIGVKSLTSFDWEKAFLFPPYMTEEGMEERVGVQFNDPSNLNRRDDIYLLVFMNDEKVNQSVEVERHGADFTIGEEEYLTPSEDVIQIEGC